MTLGLHEGWEVWGIWALGCAGAYAEDPLAHETVHGQDMPAECADGPAMRAHLHRRSKG